MSFAPKSCPNPHCQNPSHFIKKGFFKIRRTNQKVRKFQCTSCKRVFSSRTFKLDYKHKKKDLNIKLAHLLVEGNSLRGSARILGLSYSKTYKKFLWLKRVGDHHKAKLTFSAKKLQFDELETIHHTKCKPLSIALIVSEEYLVLEAKVAEMPAKGRLAEVSRKKYGPRKDERARQLKEAFREVKKRLRRRPELIESDQGFGYRKVVEQEFRGVKYAQHKRADKDKVQSRLHERKRFDPLFAVNHKCAHLRSQIRRLARRSWCTTKRPENLQLHLDLFVVMQFVGGVLC